jgi:hypothetical protein
MSKEMNNVDYTFEKNYWGNCCNTYDEETKQYVYAKYMGIQQAHMHLIPGQSAILDIGGGPASMLLKCHNLVRGKVVDPIAYPTWTLARYASNNIEVSVKAGEDIDESGWDEVWIYNCLQHVTNPAKLLNKAKVSAKILRIFEWLDIPAHEGHPHMLTKTELDSWLGTTGSAVHLAEQGCFGTAYYNIVNLH